MIGEGYGLQARLITFFLKENFPLTFHAFPAKIHNCVYYLLMQVVIIFEF